MTDERKPTTDKYKQVYVQGSYGRPYTSARIGHDDYLQTRVWKRLRMRRLKVDHYRCTECGSAINVGVHHIRYPEVWGEESLEDLITLCAACHAEVHEQDINKTVDNTTPF